MNNEYLSDFQYIGSKIKKVDLKNDFIVLDEDKMKKSLDISHSIDLVKKLEDEKVIYGIISLNVKIRLSDNEKSKYSISLTIEGCFTAPIEMREDLFKDMLKINGITALYSICRAFIISVSSQTLETGCVKLPMINVVAYSKDVSEQQPKPTTR